MQNMSEHVYYPEPQRILYRLPDSTHITPTIAGNTLVTEQPQHSSIIISPRKTQISANGLIYNDLSRNQCNNFHIPNFLDFLRNSNVSKRLFYQYVMTLHPQGAIRVGCKSTDFFVFHQIFPLIFQPVTTLRCFRYEDAVFEL